MITEVKHLIKVCPVCGRRLRIHTDFVGRLLVCQHCRGQFVADDPNNPISAEADRGGPLAGRASRLFTTSPHCCAPAVCCRSMDRPRIAAQTVSRDCADESGDGNTESGAGSLSKSANTETTYIPSVLVMEHRHGIFARLEADLAVRGVRAVRARNASEAIRQHLSNQTNVLVLNADHPTDSAWLLAAKLKLTHPGSRIWVYMNRLSTCNVALANCLMVDEVIEYESDVYRLAARICECLTELPSTPYELDDKGKSRSAS